MVKKNLDKIKSLMEKYYDKVNVSEVKDTKSILLMSSNIYILIETITDYLMLSFHISSDYKKVTNFLLDLTTFIPQNKIVAMEPFYGTDQRWFLFGNEAKMEYVNFLEKVFRAKFEQEFEMKSVLISSDGFHC